jgi:hypothetical protein
MVTSDQIHIQLEELKIEEYYCRYYQDISINCGILEVNHFITNN